jgi:hypothetical protein
MFKNVASQKWRVFAFDATDGSAKTGDAAQITAEISKDFGAEAATDDVAPTEVGKGFYEFNMLQAEVNADDLLLLPVSSTANIEVVGVPAQVHTLPPNLGVLGIETDGDLTKCNLVATTTANTDMVGTDSAATETKQDIIDGLIDTLTTNLALVVKAGPTKAEMDTAHGLLSTEAKQDIIDGLIDTLTTNLALVVKAGPTKAEMDTAHGLLGTEAKQDTIDTVVDAIKAVTDALGSGPAAKLALSAGQIVVGTVDTVTNTHTPTTTEFQADDITEATADHFNGRIIIFTSGVLLNQATSISDYVAVTGIGQFTVVAMTEAPANDDTFIIV